MSAYLKQTDYVNAYDLARDKKVIEGQAKLSDLPRLKDMILPTEGTVTYRICGMTAKKGWPGAVMELATVVPLVCNRCTKPLKTEDTLPTPNTPYGISKLVAEKIHQIWQAREANRELTIVRPGIVYGKGEHGNMTRLYNSQKKHYFFYAGRKDTVKACIYVKELVRFFQYRMIDHDFPGVDVYNCTFEPAYTIEQICSAMQAATGMKRHIPLIPGGLLMTAATILGPIGGKKVGIHPARVKKLMVSTNISGQKLAESGYAFHAGLEDTFRDWFEDCGKQGLY